MSTPEPFTITWGNIEVIAPEVLSPNDVSATAEKGNFPASVLFDKAMVDLQTAKSPPSAVWAGAFKLPFTLSKEPTEVWFKSDLRGSIRKPAGARVLLFADLNGEIFVQEFPYEQDTVGESGGTDFTYELIHRAKTLPARDYTATIFLSAIRQTGESAVTVTLDSLEITINPNLSDFNR